MKKKRDEERHVRTSLHTVDMLRKEPLQNYKAAGRWLTRRAAVARRKGRVVSGRGLQFARRMKKREERGEIK